MHNDLYRTQNVTIFSFRPVTATFLLLLIVELTFIRVNQLKINRSGVIEAYLY